MTRLNAESGGWRLARGSCRGLLCIALGAVMVVAGGRGGGRGHRPSLGGVGSWSVKGVLLSLVQFFT